MSDDFQSRAQFTVSIICPKCGQDGTIRCEAADWGKKGLDERSGKNSHGDTAIFCEDCGTVQID
jgi:hypothetical protein